MKQTRSLKKLARLMLYCQMQRKERFMILVLILMEMVLIVIWEDLVLVVSTLHRFSKCSLEEAAQEELGFHFLQMT